MSEWGVLLDGVYLGGGGGPARDRLATDTINYFNNPSYETNVSFWSGTPVRTSLASGVPNTGDWVGRITVPSTAAAATRDTTGPAVTPGEVWTSVFWLRNVGASTRPLSARLRWVDSLGALVSNADGVAAAAPSAGPFVKVFMTGTAPANAAEVEGGSLMATGGAGGEQYDVAAAMLIRGSVVPDTYWDGSTPDTEFDIYSWNGTAHASPSTHTHITPFVGEPCVPDEVGCLTLPPDGLGLPQIRTEDVIYPQTDGVRHFADWYEPRIVTLENVIVGRTSCSACPSVRERVQEIMQAWSRKCDDAELVIFTDCHGTESVTGGTGPVTGPYGLVGRPRVAQVEWLPGRSKAARLTLRFDAIDHRMFILDECGTPGSGEECVILTPDVSTQCRQYNRCYTVDCDTDGVSGWTYATTTGVTGTGPQDAVVIGTVCANPIIATLDGSLTDPFIENLDTGEFVGIAGSIQDSDEPIIVDTSTGTATQGGQSRTHLLTGNPRFRLEPGNNTLRLSSFGSTDDGSVSVCWRPAVESG